MAIFSQKYQFWAILLTIAIICAKVRHQRSFTTKAIARYICACSAIIKGYEDKRRKIMDEEKTNDIGAESAENRALVVMTLSSIESKKLMALTSREFGVSQAKAQKLIKKYGDDVMNAVLEIRDPKECPVSLTHFKKMVDGGLSAEQVQALYKTRSRFNVVPENPDHIRMQLTIVQLGHLAHRFDDFREADEDTQFELAERLINALGKNNSLSSIVIQVIERADRYGIGSLEEFLETNFRSIADADQREDDEWSAAPWRS
jgi:hypothetical protein